MKFLKSLKKLLIFLLYKQSYFNVFNSAYLYILKSRYSKYLTNKTHEINIVSETIREKELSKKIYINEQGKIINIISSPIILNQKVYGVALLSFNLIITNDDLALSSINLLNFL